jgi:hypothetical protein
VFENAIDAAQRLPLLSQSKQNKVGSVTIFVDLSVFVPESCRFDSCSSSTACRRASDASTRKLRTSERKSQRFHYSTATTTKQRQRESEVLTTRRTVLAEHLVLLEIDAHSPAFVVPVHIASNEIKNVRRKRESKSKIEATYASV